MKKDFTDNLQELKLGQLTDQSKNGIETAYQLKNISNTWVKKSTNVLGAKTVMELRGISCINLETQETKRKSKGYRKYYLMNKRLNHLFPKSNFNS